MILLEFPHISKEIVLFARKNNKYTRPIRGSMVDLRVEDMGIQHVMRDRRLMNIMAKLPDIGTQHDTYLVAVFGASDLISDKLEIDQLLSSNQYINLPCDETSDLWEITKAPWWEYVEVLDNYGMPIKAALNSTTKYTPETIDERLDEFEENRGKVDVLSPITINKMRNGTIKESYIKKLSRIR